MKGIRAVARLILVLLAWVANGAAWAQESRSTMTGPISTSERRVALVIGNAAYERGPLRNPVNDARAISERLERLGFTVIKRENLRQKDIGGTLREFRARLAPGAVGVFFYAGHGLQVKGVNYLPTVDADIETEDDVPTQSLDIAKVLELMEEAKTRVNIVLLDACRDNPYARRFRSASRGLARLDAATGTLISFSTRPGSTAYDGDGQNGLYTEHLLRHIDEPNVPIEQVLKRVGAGVKLASKGKQEPWSEGLIEGEFFFKPTTVVKLTALAPAADAPRRDSAYPGVSRRVALVIGNAGYKATPLRNARNDAEDVALALRGLGFEVTLITDADRARMYSATRDFSQSLKQGGAGLFYFAGHNVMNRSRSFLMPIDAEIRTEADLASHAIDLDLVMRGMQEARNPVNIVILDTNMDNPFAKTGAETGSLAVPPGIYLALATVPGGVAADGGGRNGVFTKHLLASLREPDLDIDRVFTRVAAGVIQETRNFQTPWRSSSLTSSFQFARP